jgi:TPR repeat protein
LELSAENGSNEAMLFLGKYYLDHSDIKENIEKSEEWLTKAARNGNVEAMRLLGKAYLTGEPYSQNISQGVMWYETAIAANDLQAILELSEFYMEGKQIPRDQKRCEELLEKVCANFKYFITHQLASDLMYRFAQYCLKGEIFPQDKQKGYKWLKQAADRGNLPAKYEYGVLLYEGKGVKRDLEQASHYFYGVIWNSNSENWLKANWMYGLSLIELRERSYYGNGKYYLEKAALNGLPEAMKDLGSYLMDGEWLEKDPVKGEEWLQKAIDHGDEHAVSELAYYYLTKQTAVKDKQKGIEMLEDAVAKGNAAALNHYGWRLVSGSVVAQEKARGERNLREAIEKG